MGLVRITLVAVALAAVGRVAAADQAARRADDLEVRTQIDQVRRVLDRFASSLDPQAKTPALASLRTAVHHLARTYRPPFATGVALVAEALARAKAVEANLDPSLQAAWADVVPWLAELGRSYRIDWRVDPANWAPRRVTDRELNLASISLAAAGENMSVALGAILKRDQVLEPLEKARTVKQLDGLARSAVDLQKAVAGHQEVSTAFARTVQAVAGLKPFVSWYPGCQNVQGQWESVQRSLDTISAAYGY